MRYFHTTTADAAESILATGFRDGSGSYGFATVELCGVFLADLPVDVNEGAKGDTVLAVDLPDDLDLSGFEIIEETPHVVWREWCVPARLLNDRATVRLLTEDEVDEIAVKRWATPGVHSSTLIVSPAPSSEPPPKGAGLAP
jgi:hypothetical protein